MTSPITDHLEVSLRAYVEPQKSSAGSRAGKPKKRSRPIARASNWTLVFDTETTTDAGQSLRFGSYQVRDGAAQHERGLFYEPDGVAPDELLVLRDYAAAHDLQLITRDEFVDQVFYGIGYDLRATIVGLNLPFDISRLAIRHGSARGDMRGGFSFTLSADKRKPALQVKHLNQKVSLIRFAAPFKQRAWRSERKRGDYVPVRRGHFVDVRTLAGALFSRSFSLDGLCKFLKVQNPKLTVEEHGVALTSGYVEYAVRDVQATWECYSELARRYDKLGLTETPLPMAYSEASIGKGYLRAIGIKPWRELQPDFPAQMLANIMGSYFGGRSEVGIRRELRQVMLCDFLSMYPTVCTLMGLWRFVIADGLTWRDGTTEVRASLDQVTLDDLLRRETWPRLTALVRVAPEGDIFPVRAKYEDEGQATIGLNHITSDRPLWFTLADCIASKLLTGRAPRIVEAVIFGPGTPQPGLKPIDIAGNPAYRIDPYQQDFYQRLIELRQSVKKKRDTASEAERESFDTEQNALKIAANATSYGILVEVNVKNLPHKRSMNVFTSADEPYSTESEKLEEPGRYFHPLLACLITGGARLMLAITERMVGDRGLDWSFCDTDSMAIAKPETMQIGEFYRLVDEVVTSFASLNPYEFGGSILKVEVVNLSAGDPSTRKPLMCWAISAKRYVLFNIGDDGMPTLRKASAHGLGHLKAPYDEASPAASVPKPIIKLEQLGVELWQHDLWWQVSLSALAGQPDLVNTTYHEALGQPAISRYAATSPKLLNWFTTFNRVRSYPARVKPFGFLYSLFAKSFETQGSENGRRTARRRRRLARPAAAFDTDLTKVAAGAFDRESGAEVTSDSLKSYRQALAQYHLHPESKFLNGDFLDTGKTVRRHVRVAGVRNIGKEADHWEEQLFLGLDGCAEVDHAMSAEDEEARIQRWSERVDKIGQRALAREMGIARGTLAKRLGARGRTPRR